MSEIIEKTLNSPIQSEKFNLVPADNLRLASLCGQCNEHLRQVENHLGVEIINRGNCFKVIGHNNQIVQTIKILKLLYEETKRELNLTPATIHLFLQDVKKSVAPAGKIFTTINTPKCMIKTRGLNQKTYIENIANHDVNFGIGPAGTGKTFLAVACAVQALEQQRVSRIVLVRPAVEAGERLGFLPGDFAQKVDPYLRPLYDALYEMLGIDKTIKLCEHNIIEIAPLAYMRGRTLNDAFIILDESQNTTKEQMKMFLTRIGFDSTAVITGDITQIDLPHHQTSGLRHATEVLKAIKGISFTFFQSDDVIRHRIVQNIVDAYEKYSNVAAEKKK